MQYSTCSNSGGQHSSDRSSCPAFNKHCNVCGKWNHFSKCCRSSKTRTYNRPGHGPSQSSRAHHTTRRGGQTHRISELDAPIAYEPADLFYWESVEVPADRGEIFTILSNSNTGKQLKVKIDTGARCNVLSRSILQYIDPDAHVDHSHVVNLVAYGGQIIRTICVTDVNFTCGTLQFHVVDSDVKPLLGLRDSVKLGFVHLCPNMHALQQGAPELTEYKALFDCSTIGKLPVVYHTLCTLQYVLPDDRR